MKKYLLMALAVCTIVSLHAAPQGDSTEEEFIAQHKARYEKQGWVWDQAQVAAIFKGIDVNGDGVASGVEQKAYWSAGRHSEPAPIKKLSKGDSTLEAYIAIQKKKWDSKGWNWNQKKVEAEFQAIDANNDGIATGLEKKAYWALR